ncbi:MAG: Asp-tRNA(Asn)/Glu-tRNA(Gln) amidotransferase subunit GatC [Acidobacteria bacterium]|nr:Asp-tRNA(Asn)/Glu-tRNA(Gln) amidotransferase subunit GatC [Acidobacteriota bacterium]
MPAQLTSDDVVRIAALANVTLDPREIALFTRQIGELLAYVEQLQQVDTAGVPPTASVRRGAAGASADRPDEVRPSLEIADTLANAPDADRSQMEGGFFRVPRVIG